jgi:hypothetical protein
MTTAPRTTRESRKRAATTTDFRRAGNHHRNVTTAAIVWVTAAVGMACGAGLAPLACATTAGHFAVVFGYPAIASRGCPPRARTASRSASSTRTAAGSSVTSSARARIAGSRCSASRLSSSSREPSGASRPSRSRSRGGRAGVESLVTTLDDLPGGLEVTTTELGRDGLTTGSAPERDARAARAPGAARPAPGQRPTGQPARSHVPTPPSTTWTTRSAPARCSRLAATALR